MKRDVRGQFGNSTSGGYTLLWVLMLGVVLVMVASTAIYAATYGLNHATRPFQRDTQFGATQGTVASVINEIESYTKGLTATNAVQAATDGQKIAADIQSKLNVQAQYVGPPFSDSNGNFYVIIQVKDLSNTGGNSGVAQLRVELPSGSSSPTTPVTPEQIPYPLPPAGGSSTQNGVTYIDDDSASDQSTVAPAPNYSGGGKYVLVQATGPDGGYGPYQGGTQPGSLTVQSGNMTIGDSSGDMLEYVASGVTVNNGDTLTVNGSMVLQGSGQLDVNSGKVNVQGDVIANTITMNSGTTLDITGQLTCTTLNLNGNAQIVVNGNASVSEQNVPIDGSLTVLQNAEFTGGFTANSGGTITIGGDMTSIGMVTVDNNTTLHVKGNVAIESDTNAPNNIDGLLINGGTYQIDGNLEETGPVTVDTSKALTVNGDAEFSLTSAEVQAHDHGILVQGNGTDIHILGNMCVEQDIYYPSSSAVVEVDKTAMVRSGLDGNLPGGKQSDTDGTAISCLIGSKGTGITFEVGTTLPCPTNITTSGAGSSGGSVTEQ
ncbi:hypothetical protein [Alicyclobacillus acidiphilus]|uniref:hypothetical protein n=1 Tax=Alicyclobacillus acidiphilus TaxID=182455 RepID=UPI000837A844|nr:hypothetical protein [Alicyclobacillus acidiphilus]